VREITDDSRVWQVTKQARDILAALPEKKIRSIGVAGPMRMGKSYLMNRIAGVQQGFEVGPYVVGCTRWALGVVSSCT